uniref:Uncharacterized protein n=1 Tax=Rhizophora mucronata TaxID=61149 RepID=A0A2P2R3T2_RHIMU
MFVSMSLKQRECGGKCLSAALHLMQLLILA